MFFTSRNMELNSTKFIRNTAYYAKVSILLHTVTPGEEALDRYLIENFGHGLRDMSLWLLTQCQYLKNRSNEITVIFKTTFANQIASLITYGTGPIKGSKILANAFGRNIERK